MELVSLLKSEVRSPPSIAGESDASLAKTTLCQLPAVEERWKLSSSPVNTASD